MGTPPSWSPVTARPVWTCLRSGRRSLGWPYRGVGKPSSGSGEAPYSEIDVRSQCSRATSRPNTPIARAPTDPTIWSNCGATASSARPIRSSLSTCGSIPQTSWTAHWLAHCSTWTSGVGEVSRLATSAWMRCPWVTSATSRTGQARSMIPARSSRRHKSAITGNAPNALSTLGAPNWARSRARGRIGEPCHIPVTTRASTPPQAYQSPCAEDEARRWRLARRHRSARPEAAGESRCGGSATRHQQPGRSGTDQGLPLADQGLPLARRVARTVRRGAHRLRAGPLEALRHSADEYLKVHDQGPGQADVTEGSGGIWERLHYDWSDPNRVVLTTTDSNVWGGDSGHTYTFTRQPNGTIDVDVVVVREGKNLKGRVLAIVLGTIGKRALGKALAKTVKAIEARSDGARAAELPPRPKESR